MVLSLFVFSVELFLNCFCAVFVVLFLFDQRKDVSIHKRTVLGKLPPNVVLHLNRFKMNLDTFQTEKVNTRFDFPSVLNLEPFTKEVRVRVSVSVNVSVR